MFTQLTFGNQAITHFFIGFGFALLNLILRYVAPWMPQVISVLLRRNIKRALIIAYLVALVIELATSPLFASAFHSKYVEFAWSPYESIFDVLGVVAIDLLVLAWRGLQKGATVGAKQVEVMRGRAAHELVELHDRAIGHTAPTPQAETGGISPGDQQKRIND